MELATESTPNARLSAECREVVSARRRSNVTSCAGSISTSRKATSFPSWVRRVRESQPSCTSSGCTTAPGPASHYFMDQPVHRLNPKQRSELHKKHIGFVFQSYHSARQPDRLRESGDSSFVSKRESQGSSEHGRRRAGPFSDRRQERPVSQPAFRGQQQLVGVARAVIANLKCFSPTSRRAICTQPKAKRSWTCFVSLNEARNHDPPGDALGSQCVMRNPDHQPSGRMDRRGLTRALQANPTSSRTCGRPRRAPHWRERRRAPLPPTPARPLDALQSRST